jgi:hypothetical protein
MNYKFPQFNTEITDPEITVVTVSDNVKQKTCNVELLLETDTAKFGLTLSGFTYETTWEDSDVYAWVLQELETHNTQINEMDS